MNNLIISQSYNYTVLDSPDGRVAPYITYMNIELKPTGFWDYVYRDLVLYLCWLPPFDMLNLWFPFILNLMANYYGMLD